MTLSRNPFAARAARALNAGDGSPWEDPAAASAHALALATIGAVDELRRANQIALATALGDKEALAGLAEVLGLGEDSRDRRTRKAA